MRAEYRQQQKDYLRNSFFG